MASPRVLIIGAGTSGPILAILLKMRGYDPTVYERLSSIQEAGLSLMLQSSSIQLLGQIPEFIDAVNGQSPECVLNYSTVVEDPGFLGGEDLPANGLLGVSRTEFNRTAVRLAVDKYNIEVKLGYRLVRAEQDANSVTATFENGETASGTFMVGCDGLHSAVCSQLFGALKSDFTGVIQAGGVSPTPKDIAKKMLAIYGNGEFVISYPISPIESMWSCTLEEEEHKETWHPLDEAAKNDFKKDSPISRWDYGVADLVSSSRKIIKYGLYDRPALDTWHRGRIVLLGDAAHPTSPHLGQGANQALEDINALTSLLDAHQSNLVPVPLTADILSKIFTQYEKVRIPRSDELVKEARRQGEIRTVSGVEACLARNAKLRERLRKGL